MESVRMTLKKEKSFDSLFIWVGKGNQFRVELTVRIENRIKRNSKWYPIEKYQDAIANFEAIGFKRDKI